MVDFQVHLDSSVSFSRYCLYKMLTSIILVSILGKCRESFTRSSGKSPHRSFFLFTKEPVSESTQEKAKARDDLTHVTEGEMFEAR